MKLKNKLIPITGLAAVTAVVTPLSLTSCGTSINMTDVSKACSPEIEPHVQGNMGQHACNQEYFGSIKTNADIFIKDYIYGKYLTWQNYAQGVKYYDGTFKAAKLNVGISTPTFGSVTIDYPGEPSITYPTISVTFKNDLDFTEEYANGNRYSLEHYVISSTATYKNVPFYVQPDSSEDLAKFGEVTGYWTAAIPYVTDAQWVYDYNTSDWSIQYDYSFEETSKYVSLREGSSEYTWGYTDSDTISKPADLYNALEDSRWFEQDALTLSYPSYFLSKINQVPEINSAGNMKTYDTVYAASGEQGELSSIQLGTYYDSDDEEHYVSFNDSALQMTKAMHKTVADETTGAEITLYGDIDEETGRGKDSIVLQQIDVEEGDTATTLEIKNDGTSNKLNIENKGEGEGDFEGFYGYALPAATLGTTKKLEIGETKTYKFKLPHYIVAEFKYKDVTEPVVQKIYLNQTTTSVTVTCEEEE